MNSKVIIVIGPTASGKSSFSLDLAERINGSIISADSMQIYRGFNIGTAKIMPDEYKGIDHYMIDILNPDQEYSVSLYKEQAMACIDNIKTHNKIPIITGGTGLYINSLIYPMSFGSETKDDELRHSLNEELKEYGAEFIHNKLLQIAPEAASNLHPNNTRRVIRAIELALKDKLIVKDEISCPVIDYVMVGLNIDRELLYTRINNRVDEMFRQGLTEEVNSLSDKYSFDIQAMQAIGYKEFKEYFDGSIDIDTLKEKIKKNTRNYAKRQMTWFRRYADIKWFNPLTQYEEGIEYVMRNI